MLVFIQIRFPLSFEKIGSNYITWKWSIIIYYYIQNLGSKTSWEENSLVTINITKKSRAREIFHITSKTIMNNYKSNYRCSMTSRVNSPPYYVACDKISYKKNEKNHFFGKASWPGCIGLYLGAELVSEVLLRLWSLRGLYRIRNKDKCLRSWSPNDDLLKY